MVAEKMPNGRRYAPSGYKGGIWREKPPGAESAVGARVPKVWANARTCPVHIILMLNQDAVLGGVCYLKRGT